MRYCRHSGFFSCAGTVASTLFFYSSDITVHTHSAKSLRLSFNNQSIRQLLEQLESNQHELRKKASQGGIIIRTKSVSELLESDWIESFPKTWQHRQGKDAHTPTSPSSSSTSIIPAEAPLDSSRVQKYADLRSRIVTLQAKYQTLKEKHEYYKVNNTLRGTVCFACAACHNVF